jgi:hypothetical protein
LPVFRRARVLATLLLVLAATLTPAVATPVAAAGPKVAIIVGPTGSITDSYRRHADRVASAASEAGATVTKAYSPRATWSRVREAVAGANIIIYFGHGNGYPNPYSSTEWTDRANGWGLNRTTQNGDKDDWSRTLVYCGEKALLGTLTASDGAAQRRYCKGGINPAPGFVMVYGQAHYAPGFGERYQRSDPKTTYRQARQRVRNYSSPIFALGGSAYYATAYGDAHRIVGRLLTDTERSFGWVFRQGIGFDRDALRKSEHPDADGQIWVQKTVIRGFHFGDPDYWYAFAGAPGRSVSDAVQAAVVDEAPTTLKPRPARGSTGVSIDVRPQVTFSERVTRVNANTMTLLNTASGELVPGEVRYLRWMETARFIPDKALEPNTRYRVRLAGWITDLGGNRLGYVSWGFTTGG